MYRLAKVIDVTKYTRVRLVTSFRGSETSTKIKLACFKSTVSLYDELLFPPPPRPLPIVLTLSLLFLHLSSSYKSYI